MTFVAIARLKIAAAAQGKIEVRNGTHSHH
jgi:hypothetical protein